MSFSNGRALVVGVANYNEVSPLPEAVLNDARDITSALTSSQYCGFQPTNVRVLLDDQATLGAIRSALNELAAESSPEDTVLIFFSGHGGRVQDATGETSALIPVDCSFNDLQATTLPEAEFSKALAAIPAKRLLVFIDACHSGGAGSLKGFGPEQLQPGFSEKSLERLAQGAGRVIIASSRASETSLVLGGARNSVFTQHLLEALKGEARTDGDGLIRVFEVFNHVSEKVRGTVPGRQHPIFKASDLEDNFPVALDRGGAKGLSQPASGETILWRQIEEILADLYPVGPLDQEIWVRAGGDVSRLRLGGTGRSAWFSALRTLKLGGGGSQISQQTLLKTALGDFPHHRELAELLKRM